MPWNHTVKKEFFIFDVSLIRIFYEVIKRSYCLKEIFLNYTISLGTLFFNSQRERWHLCGKLKNIWHEWEKYFNGLFNILWSMKGMSQRGSKKKRIMTISKFMNIIKASCGCIFQHSFILQKFLIWLWMSMYL